MASDRQSSHGSDDISIASSSENPHHNADSVFLGQELFNKHEYADAVRVLSDVVQVDKHNIEALATLGAAYYHLNDLEKAEKRLKECLHIDVEHCFSLYYLSLTCDANKDGLSALVYLENAIRFCTDDEQLLERAQVKRENLRQAYKEKPLVSRYPRLSSYGWQWCTVLCLEILILVACVMIGEQRLATTEEQWLMTTGEQWQQWLMTIGKQWLVMGGLLLLGGTYIGLFIVSRTNGVKVYEDKIIFNHGLLWVSNTPVKFIQVHPPQEIKNPWDIITGNTKIRIPLIQELSLPYRKGKYSTMNVVVVPSIGDRKFMEYLSRHITNRATGANFPIRSEIPDQRMPY